MPIIVVKLSFHFVRPTEGGLHQGDQSANVAQTIAALNAMYGALTPPVLPVSPPAPFISDTRIRFELRNIYYWTNDEVDMHATNTLHQYFNGLYGVEGNRVVNIYYSTMSTVGGYGEQQGAAIVMINQVASDGPVLLGHELGHLFGLQHTFGAGPGYCSGDPYDDTFFPDGNPFWADCDPEAPWEVTDNNGNVLCSGVGISNNVMGANGCRNYFSPKQIGQIHRQPATSYAPVGGQHLPARWVQCEPSPLAEVVHIVQDATWNMNRLINQGIIVEPGATLTLQCKLYMGHGAGITVKPGGRLIIDSGIITSMTGDCDSFWPGIQVWGTANQHQFPANNPTYQGLVVLKNGATIEHAREGIQTLRPGDWSTAGGVVQVNGTHSQIGGTFLNCRRAVSFVPYQNFLPGHPEVKLPNNSIFNYAAFKVDANYREGNFVYYQATIWGVDGVIFRACTFENAQQNTTVSSQLGKGIYSIDANYSVIGSCNVTLPLGTPCAEVDLDRSRFIGMDHGISALNSSSSRSITVKDTDFQDNICGVYVNGVVGYQVKNCRFTMGGRNVTLDGDEDGVFDSRHRGIFSTEAWAFTVMDNTLEQGGPHVETEGIVVGYSRDHNDMVFRNHVSGLERGYIGEGVAADPASGYTSVRGLQFICNENMGNLQNMWSRKLTGDPNSDPNTHTIRTSQGDPYHPADNTYDQQAGPNGVGDFSVTTTNGVIVHWNRNTGAFVPTYYTNTPQARLFPQTVLGTPGNRCTSRIHLTIPEDQTHTSGMAEGPIRDYLLDEKLAFGNTRYLYELLLDGGSTDEVVVEIQDTWPQDAWTLREYLLVKSPYLSVEALIEMVEKGILPDAMITEILIANPEATQKDGFMDWLQDKSGRPLPEYMAAMVEASWETKTYRTTLEGEMAYHHAEMSQAATLLLERHTMDEDGASPEELRAVWQLVRTPAARYAEALTFMDEGRYNDAATVIAAMPTEHKMKTPETLEQQRMLDLLAFLGPIHADGRNNAELNVDEVRDLEVLRGSDYDRPATWISNLLCFHYGICRAPLSGGTDGPKSLSRWTTGSLKRTAQAGLLIHPNPADTWVAFTCDLMAPADHAALVVRDMAGREVWRASLQGTQEQAVWAVL